MLSGLIDLPWWGYVVYTLAVTHITIAGVTIFLHRCQAHRALELHPIVSHFFRFWLWFTTSMVTKEWAAIHRKHHAKCETVDDPHSPQVAGINKVLWDGVGLYSAEARNQETLDRYGHGTPDDWLERHVYAGRPNLGISLLVVLNLVLFGPIGLTIWAVQMAWIPFFAAGVINGIGHFWGYRNYACQDASRNILPWGILIGGEELHNNHHAYATSARLSARWYEFDIGWMYIRIMEMLGLARVKKTAPRLRQDKSKTACDLETLQAVISNRYDVLANYARSVRGTWMEEVARLSAASSLSRVDFEGLKIWLRQDAAAGRKADEERVRQVVKESGVLDTVYTLRQDLAALWDRRAADAAELVKHLEDWCRRAEESGVQSLANFSRELRSYA